MRYGESERKRERERERERINTARPVKFEQESLRRRRVL
jgi:hypothetical protein